MTASTRRTLLAGLALPAAAACGSTVSIVPPSYGAADHPDAELLELERRYIAARSAAYAASERLDAICAALVRPEPPAAVFLREEDHALKLASYSCERDDGRRWYRVEAADSHRRYLRREHFRWHSRPVRPEDRLPADAIGVTKRLPWPEAQARADEIVAAWDGWQAELDHMDEVSGLAAAEVESDRLDDLRLELRYEMWAATARTLDGLAVKARLAEEVQSQREHPDLLIAGLARDILALAGGIA